MKNVIKYSWFIALIAVLVVVSLYQKSQVDTFSSTIESTCADQPDSAFTSRRSLGLVVKNNTLLSVKLENEKNFSPPGGHIEPNETPEIALKREFKEELNVEVADGDIKPYKTFCELLGSRLKQRTRLFMVEAWSGDLVSNSKTQIKWADASFSQDSRADTELVKSIEFLVNDKILQ